MQNFIFLDIDGVLNHQSAYKADECKCVKIKNSSRQYVSFSSVSKSLLNDLIKLTDAKIIVSSSWRHSGLEYLKDVWANENMNGEIIGLTPELYGKDLPSIPRGMEIDLYLNRIGYRHINYCADTQYKYMMTANINNYIIIDDDSDMLYNQRNHFIHTNSMTGFDNIAYNKSISILSKSIIELNYE